MKEIRNNQKPLVLAVCLLVISIIINSCASLDDNLKKSRDKYFVEGKQIHLTDMRNSYRFAEIGLITGTSKSNAVVNIWNTTGVSDPTPENFAKIDEDKLAKDFDARKIWLNAPRRWTFDEFWVFEAGVETDFQGIKGVWMGVVGAQDIMKATVQGSYYPAYIYRNSKFKFNAGSEVYLLDAPDGEVFIMQSYTDHYDKRVIKENLPKLGDMLKMPEGWNFRVKILEQDLEVTQIKADNFAHVLQDDLHNTYQGSDGGKAFSYIP
jgi:hypothetical protein